MSDLLKATRDKMAFNAREVYEASDGDRGFSVGAGWQHEALTPILEAALNCIEALMECECDCTEANHVTGLMQKDICWRCDSLDKLKAVGNKK